MTLRVAISKRLRADRREFQLDVQFETSAGVTVLFGPSGAGKTLTLYAIAGLLRPDRGSIRLDATPLFDSERRIDLPARQRAVGFVFQDYALFPHLNVLQNVAFGRRRGWLNAPARSAQDDELLDAFELGGCRQAYPADLSGGQRQRVALARALAAQPRILLLDEPFAALDAPLRQRVRSELLELQRRRGLPIVVITHDPDDVAALGGQVIALDQGRIVAPVRGSADAQPVR